VKLFRVVLVPLCVVATSLVVSAGPANATPTPVLPPTANKLFSLDPTIPLNGTTRMGIQVGNPNTTTTLTGVSMTDTLPAGLVALEVGSVSICGGTITITASSISFTNLTVPPGGFCATSPLVQGTTLGPKVNTTSAPTSTNGGTGLPATATLMVGSPPTISKAFGTSPITVGSSTALTFTLANPNAADLTGAAFTDSLPAGLVVSSPGGPSGTCAATLTGFSPGSGSLGVSGGTIPASSSCTLTVPVTGTTTGTKNNTTSALTTTEGLTGTAAIASLVVQPLQPPTFAKSFGAPTIGVGQTTTLTFDLLNPNATSPLSGIIFTDPLPLGLRIATPNGLVNTCGGIAQAVAGSGALSLSGVSLSPGAKCALQVNVRTTSTGVKNNKTTPITSNEAGLGNRATASITVTP